jgi:hypothetical protein
MKSDKLTPDLMTLIMGLFTESYRRMFTSMSQLDVISYIRELTTYMHKLIATFIDDVGGQIASDDLHLLHNLMNDIRAENFAESYPDYQRSDLDIHVMFNALNAQLTMMAFILSLEAMRTDKLPDLRELALNMIGMCHKTIDSYGDSTVREYDTPPPSGIDVDPREAIHLEDEPPGPMERAMNEAKMQAGTQQKPSRGLGKGLNALFGGNAPDNG